MDLFGQRRLIPKSMNPTEGTTPTTYAVPLLSFVRRA